MSGVLEVRYGATVVGHLRVDDAGRFSFVYDPGWRTRDTRFPVSLTLPISAEEYVEGPARTFFTNLLPEGGARQAVCERLGISPDNDFALLQAIGGECAGALSLNDPKQRPVDPEMYSYEELSRKSLQGLVVDHASPLLIGGPTTRLSLAGAQDKIPVALLDGKLHLPQHAAPSTHILKLPNQRYPHLTVNEAFSLGLARQIGLAVVDCELFEATKPPSLLVTRYDRIATDDPWPARRLHQEDLCQALGLPPARKYEAEGGPALAQAVTVVRDNVYQPLIDAPRVIEWQIYNIILGNSDGHGKNLSIVYSDEGAELAPFYDLLSTRQYKNLDRKLAMKVGGRSNPDEIGRAEWIALSKELHIGERIVLELVRDTAQRVLDLLTSWTRDFREAHGAQPILETLPGEIRKRARGALRRLSA